MAELYIKGIPDELKRQIRIKCASEGITLKELVVPLLESAVRSKVESKASQK